MLCTYPGCEHVAETVRWNTKLGLAPACLDHEDEFGRQMMSAKVALAIAVRERDMAYQRRDEAQEAMKQAQEIQHLHRPDGTGMTWCWLSTAGLPAYGDPAPPVCSKCHKLAMHYWADMVTDARNVVTARMHMFGNNTRKDLMMALKMESLI